LIVYTATTYTKNARIRPTLFLRCQRVIADHVGVDHRYLYNIIIFYGVRHLIRLLCSRRSIYSAISLAFHEKVDTIAANPLVKYASNWVEISKVT
jgi:hypothetical protein